MCNLRESARQFFVQKCEIAADYGFFLYSFPDFAGPSIFSQGLGANFAPRGSEQNGRLSSCCGVIFDLFNLLAKSNCL